ncbi:sodium/proton antiporter NhaB [Maridesulfovibrio salexigens]|uniref:Na+H+ antiporter NhaB n=1 Tax=Maridesulfovibrio salexigens (strain ATCC 14822 / DSM 2638 / NCIMB 8403 / VKM B-1763) TaxID=526222 RepID=C6BSV0_MARSD|nr:sodium/proton antiporter NhaB [Maridesulfovibrio salexigens]ACS81556.1 Na+H+ antiporter NhaB [Maridesulfovibrio salexigens DSM 2638]
MPKTMSQALQKNLLGNSPDWYKLTIIGFLILNPILMAVAGPFITGWVLIGQFIFTLAMALKCYPLPAGGLLAVEAIALGLASPETVYNETVLNFPVILLLMFMVAGIHFMKDMLQYAFTKIITRVKSKIVISLLFSLSGAVLSAFLDALTVTAVIIAVAYGFYGIYHRFASTGKCSLTDDSMLRGECVNNLSEFRGFLRNLMMHGAVGTALGGVCTIVGEPQNLLIGKTMGWEFMEFFFRVAPVSMPVLAVGLVTCIMLEVTGIFGYGYQLPQNVREILEEEDRKNDEEMSLKKKAALFTQACAAIFLVLALAFHIAEVGLIGLTVIVVLTALNGITEEHQIGHAFEEALPFTALLVVFFAVVGVIHEQHLFAPIIHYVLGLEGKVQLAAYYIANGVLSMISDNVFVATVYVSETLKAFQNGVIGREQFDLLAVAINTGTNIPSVATPNGQAAFLFLLTSAIAPLIRLSYGQMVKMAFPYTITMSITGLAATWYFL